MIEAVFGLVGVVVGSAITITKDAWSSWRDRRRRAAYAAIRVVCILEEYADKCVGVVQDDGTAYGRPAGRTDQGEEFLEPQVAQPASPEYPDDLDWRSLDASLMQRALSFPNVARSTDRFIAIEADFSAPPSYDGLFEARRVGYGRLGLEALEISAALRKLYKIDAIGRNAFSSDWDPDGYLRDTLAKFEKEKAEARSSSEALL